MISNAPYFVVLDCDHYCNDPSAARQAMCFYFDPEISSKLAWVQFPQHFHNISEHDIYDGNLHYYWVWFLKNPALTILSFVTTLSLGFTSLYIHCVEKMQREWEGLDGLRGPTITGCNFFMRREAFYGIDTLPRGTCLFLIKTFLNDVVLFSFIIIVICLRC